MFPTSPKYTVCSHSGLHGSVGGATVIKSKGCGFKSHPGQSFSLSLCGPNSSSKVDLRWNNWEHYFTVVRSHSNLKTLLSICYWRTTNNDFLILVRAITHDEPFTYCNVFPLVTNHQSICHVDFLGRSKDLVK